MRYFLIAIILAVLIGSAAAGSMEVSGGTVNEIVTVTLDEPAFIIFQLDGGVPIYAYGTQARFLPHTTGTLSITAHTTAGPVSSMLTISSGGGSPGGGGDGDGGDTPEPWQTVTLESGTFTITAEEGTSFSVDRRTALGALHASGTSYTFSDAWWESYGSLYLTSVDGRRNEGVSGWMFQVNGATPGTGANACTVRDGDEVIFYFSESMSSTPSTSDYVVSLRVSIPSSSGESGTGGDEVSPSTKITASSGDLPVPHLLGLPAGAELKITPSGQYLTIDLPRCNAGGEEVAMDHNNLIITREDLVMTIRFIDFTEKNGVFSGYVEKIAFDMLPVYTELVGCGKVSVDLSAELFVVPVDAEIETLITDTPPIETREALSRVAAAAGLQVETIAYVLIVDTGHLIDGEDIGKATITMSIPPDWVDAHGGASAIHILRIGGEDTGEVLDTSCRGTNEGRWMECTATSPRGLSTFALAALGEAAPSLATEMNARNDPLSTTPPEVQDSAAPQGTGLHLAFAGGAALTLVAGLILYRRGRR
jgi:hypothetical protein